MARDGSWWLKVKRAQEHFVEIKAELRRYSDKRPYKVEWLEPTKKQPRRWRYILRITEQPNPMLALMIGDFTHNLRSALDHWVGAHVPSKRAFDAFMPMEQADPWQRDAAGHLLRNYRNARRRFKSAIEGLPSLTLPLIRGMQPYQLRPLGTVQSPLGIISRLDNADKHRDLIQITAGVRLSRLLVIRHEIVSHEITPKGRFVEDGAIVAAFTAGPDLRQSEVHVQVSGPMHVSINLPPLGGGSGMDKFEVAKILLNGLKQERLALELLDVSTRYDPAGTYDLVSALGASYFPPRDFDV